MTLLSGASRVEITPPPGCTLMGYGAREGVASRIHDELYARALAISPESDESAGIIVISAELCLMAPEQAREIREKVANDLPIGPDQVLVACTHTHSGPDTGLGEFRSGRPLPDWVEDVFAGIAEAGRQAWAAREPARLAWHFASARIGRNRRIEDGPLDPEVSVLRVVARAGSRTIAIAYRHACHGTVLGHDNLEISADWAGVTSAELERAHGGVAPFLLGAHADIDPRTRGLMDLAIDGQSRGLGFDAVHALGSEVAAAIERALDDSEGIDVDDISAATAHVELPVHLGNLSESAARAALSARKAELAEWMGISADNFPRLMDLSDRVALAVQGRSVDEIRERVAQARMYVRDKTAPFFVGNRRSLDVEVQVLRLGPVALLCIPVEPTTEVGLDWHARSAPRFHGAVVGIANGWLRYLPHPKDLAHPEAHRHYEVLSSTFAADACERILDAAEALL